MKRESKQLRGRLFASALLLSFGALRRETRACRVLPRALGAMFLLYALTISAAFLHRTASHGDVYSTGWWMGYVDKLEDERRLWRLICVWLPALDACGLLYSAFGLPFTGSYAYDWQLNALVVAPCLGVMLGLSV